MHIPDGFLTGEAVAVGWAAGAGGLAVCLRRAAAEGRERDLPVAGLAAAFFLVGDAPLFPIAVGTQGHLLGGMLAVALLGPWLGAATSCGGSAPSARWRGCGRRAGRERARDVRRRRTGRARPPDRARGPRAG